MPFRLAIACQFVAPLARFAVAKIEHFLDTIQIKEKSRTQVRLNKGFRGGGSKPERRFDGDCSERMGGKEGLSRRMEGGL